MSLDAAPFKIFGQPIGAGAYLYFGPTENLYPVLMSYYDLGRFGNDNECDRILVQPGYKLDIYNSVGYETLMGSYSNVDGTTNAIIDITNNQVSSCRLYYGTTELLGGSTSLSAANVTSIGPAGTNTDVPTTGSSYVIPYRLKNSHLSAFCPVYMTGNTGAYPIFFTIYDFTAYGMKDSDDFYLIAPHFTIIVWQDVGYSNNGRKYENGTDEWVVFAVPSGQTNKGSSCRVYYYGKEISYI
jgi:hypothetical protein